jgi:acetylornithine deacetylase/succinyl-diaminopimelate desuccinylase-like protein
MIIALASLMTPGSGQNAVAPNALGVPQQSAHDIFKALIEINTTVDRGCTKAAEAMAARLRAAGFPEKDIHLVGAQPQHTNLVVRYCGKGTLKPVLFIGHLDVVEARREDWSMDPFLLSELDGYYYGRGTIDMKNEDACMIANLIRLRQEGFVPDRDIIVALTEDEEGGDANGISWLLENHRELIEAEFCINPDSGGGDIKNGKHSVMELQTCEKIYIDYTMEVKNKGGHSSRPVKDNVIYRLAAALTRLSNYDFPIRFNETTRMFFKRSATNEVGQTKADMLAVGKIPTDLGAANRLAAASSYYNSMLRTTCVATMLSGGHAENALPQIAKANINCRMHPDDSPEYVFKTLKSIVADSMVSITATYSSVVSPRSPLRKEVMEILEKLTATMWPGVIVTPVMSTGASDSKYIRAAGVPVYGISGMFTDIDDNRAHGKDERIGVKEFYDGIEFTYRLMKALTKVE